MVLSGHDDLPWAIYSIGSLGEGNELVSASFTYTEEPIRPDDGTKLYFAIANYLLDRWEWIDLPLSHMTWEPAAGTADHYRSPDGAAHLAVTLDGPGKGYLSTVTFTYGGEELNVPKPQNLTAVCDASHEVCLNWDEVDGAVGYNLYRSRDPEFSSKIRVNLGLISRNNFTDYFDTRGEYLYYYVTACAANESSPSNIVEVWCMGADLPAPSGLSVINRGEDRFSGGWDWDNPPHGNPYSFTIFLDTVPNFTMESESMLQWSVHGGTRFNTFHNIEKGIVYYWKICATDETGFHGRMSEELTGTVITYWTWSDAVTISAGQAPVRVISDGGKIALAYFDDYRVMFAIQSDDGWIVECVMDEYLNNGPSFDSYVDLSYSNGKYFIASQAVSAGDCWFAEWDSTDDEAGWVQTRIHGDGAKLMDSPKSGFYLTMAVDDSEVAVLQYYLTEFSLVMHTRAVAGGTWNTQEIRTGFTPGCTPCTSAHYLDGNLYVLSTHNYSDELLLADRCGGWQWQDVRDGAAPKLSKHLDLHRFMGEWVTPAQHNAGKDLYLIHGTTLPWAADLFPTIHADSGHYARLAVDGDEAFVIEYFDEYYNYALYSEGWNLGPVIVPGVEKYVADADVTLLSQMPYLAFEDKMTMEIKVARGAPPAE